MNADKKELIETGILAVLTVAFTVFAFLCAKWGLSYQIIVVFSTLAGSGLGALGMKIKATSSNGNGAPLAAPKQ